MQLSFEITVHFSGMLGKNSKNHLKLQCKCSNHNADFDNRNKQTKKKYYRYFHLNSKRKWSEWPENMRIQMATFTCWKWTICMSINWTDKNWFKWATSAASRVVLKQDKKKATAPWFTLIPTWWMKYIYSEFTSPNADNNSEKKKQ